MWVEITLKTWPLDFGDLPQIHSANLPSSLEDWVRRPDKQCSNISVIWRSVLNSFDIIDAGLAWRIGNGTKVRIGSDPWPGSDMRHILPQPLIDFLRDEGILKLSHLDNPDNTTLWHQGWESTRDLGLEDVYHQGWNQYLKALSAGHIRLADREDELVWALSALEEYIQKVGYIHLNATKINGALKRWWKSIWRSKCSAKAHIFMWCVLESKVLTWDIPQRRFMIGPGWSPLCKAHEELISHLFLECPFSSQVWFSCKSVLGHHCQWIGAMVEES